jgi:hypothetical protein
MLVNKRIEMIMPVFIVFCLFLLTAVYAVCAAAAYRRRLACYKERRSVLVSLCVKRANLMPALMNAARKRSPVPSGIYTRFTEARDRFSAAKTDEEFREANNRLDAVFNDFTAHYEGWASPEYIKAREELEAVNEKMAFERTFFDAARAKLSAAKKGPLMPGIIICTAMDNAFSSIWRGIKKWGSKWTTTTKD